MFKQETKICEGEGLVNSPKMNPEPDFDAPVNDRYKEKVDKELTYYVERGRKRFPEIFANEPRRFRLTEMRCFHLKHASYADMTREGLVPCNAVCGSMDLGEYVNDAFGWKAKLSYEFLESAVPGTMRIIVTNASYRDQWLLGEAKRAAMAIYGVMKRRGLLSSLKVPELYYVLKQRGIVTSTVPRVLIWRSLKGNTRTWEQVWDKLIAERKRLKTE